MSAWLVAVCDERDLPPTQVGWSDADMNSLEARLFALSHATQVWPLSDGVVRGRLDGGARSARAATVSRNPPRGTHSGTSCGNGE